MYIVVNLNFIENNNNKTKISRQEQNEKKEKKRRLDYGPVRRYLPRAERRYTYRVITTSSPCLP